jgi:hypothetical protein
MRSLVAAAALFGSFFGSLGGGSQKVDFDGIRPGSAPPNWVFESARLQVRPDATAPSQPNVMQLTPGQSGSGGASIAQFNPVVCRDGDLSVKFRIANGKAAKAAGVVWRYRDSANYYLLDFNADRKNVALYRVKDGVPHPVAIHGGKAGTVGIAHDVRAGQWYVARVIFHGDSIRVLLGNRRIFDATDSGLATAGRAGVTTKGDASASFDDFRIEKRS